MKARSAQEIFTRFQGVKVLVIGDVMLDRYVKGEVKRISPEAPVPIVDVLGRHYRLGGAANVALNVQALGGIPLLCGVIGNDAAGREFMKAMSDNNLGTQGILTSSDRCTTTKSRIVSHGHQLLRIDEEVDLPLEESDRERFLKRINNFLQDCDVVVFEDYDKGAIDKETIATVINQCNQKGIPVAVDPKKRNFSSYQGATLFKPNFKELNEGLGKSLKLSEIKNIQKVAEELQRSEGFKNVLVTLSEEGVVYCSDETSGHHSAHYRNIADVSGAGDTVISIAALCMATGLTLDVTAEIANLGGGIVCESSGVVPIEQDSLQKEVQAFLSSL